MRKLKIVLFCMALFTFMSQAAVAQEKKEKIQASYMLAFGRPPAAGELTHWMNQRELPVRELVELHRQYSNSDKGTKRALIIKSYKDALGRVPTEAEIKYWSSGNDNYTDLMRNHINWLTGNPGEYESVIRRSYVAILGRQPDDAEMRYWKGQGTLSYCILVSCHDNWKRTNGQTAKKTGGSSSISGNSSLLNTVPVSPSVANEVKAIMNSNGVVSAGGGNVVSVGGGNVVSVGGGNVIAVGGGN